MLVIPQRFGGLVIPRMRAADGLVFVDSATSANSATVTGPSAIQSGDLLVMGDFANAGLATPSGFTSVISRDDGAEGTVISYKIADGSEADAAITGMGGNPWTKVLLVFRLGGGISSVSAASIKQQVTSGNPSPQTVTSGSGTPPLIAFGVYGAFGRVDPRTMTPAKDGEDGVAASGGEELWLAFKIYNEAPENVTVDMNDEGAFNMLLSFYLSVS